MLAFLTSCILRDTPPYIKQAFQKHIMPEESRFRVLAEMAVWNSGQEHVF